MSTDARIATLRRQASTGDVQAAEALLREWDRAGLPEPPLAQRTRMAIEAAREVGYGARIKRPRSQGWCASAARSHHGGQHLYRTETRTAAIVEALALNGWERLGSGGALPGDVYLSAPTGAFGRGFGGSSAKCWVGVWVLRGADPGTVARCDTCRGRNVAP